MLVMLVCVRNVSASIDIKHTRLSLEPELHTEVVETLDPQRILMLVLVMHIENQQTLGKHRN